MEILQEIEPTRKEREREGESLPVEDESRVLPKSGTIRFHLLRSR